mmetsp:Transcript_112549/g.363519  ORF Transcript_112549/g.363519 Transcript_112549/m.363519 type:complete len:234 (-) Transcript_112549:54-755(-)
MRSDVRDTLHFGHVRLGTVRQDECPRVIADACDLLHEGLKGCLHALDCLLGPLLTFPAVLLLEVGQHEALVGSGLLTDRTEPLLALGRCLLIHELHHLLVVVGPWQDFFHHVVHHSTLLHHLSNPHIHELVHVEVFQVHVARLVVLQPFFVVGKYGECLRDPLKLLFGIWIIPVLVRVILEGALPVGLLYIVSLCAFRHPEDLVEVLLREHVDIFFCSLRLLVRMLYIPRGHP